MIIAIDGKAGTGKSTLAKEIAKKMNYIYLDTGAMYRTCTYYFLKNNIEITEDNVNREVENIHIEIKYTDGEQRLILNGEDVTGYIRSKDVNDNVSEVAVIGSIREKMVIEQRKLANKENVILDGRDIGTVVFPNAELKLFLVTDIEERVKRRMLEYKEKNIEMTEENLKENMLKRDNIDSTRKNSPLKKADDAIEIDTTKYTIDELVQMVIKMIEERAK